MPETQTPTLKRRKSTEEIVEAMGAAPMPAVADVLKAGLEGEFRRMVEAARSGFVMYQFWLGLMLLSLFIGFSQPIFLALALVFVVCSAVSFQRAVIQELRGSYEAGVIVLLKAIEGRPANPMGSLAEQASQIAHSGSLEAERQQRIGNVRLRATPPPTG